MKTHFIKINMYIVCRERWSQLLDKRREYLNSQIQQYINKLDKTEVKFGVFTQFLNIYLNDILML